MNKHTQAGGTIDILLFVAVPLLAMVVYWLIALAIVRLLVMSRTVSTPEAAAHLQRRDA